LGIVAPATEDVVELVERSADVVPVERELLPIRWELLDHPIPRSQVSTSSGSWLSTPPEPELTEHRPLRPVVAGGRAFGTLVAGHELVCGITNGLETWCAGLNEDGQLGDGTHGQGLPSDPDDPKPPVTVVGPQFDSIVGGGHFSCGIATSKEVYCWGYGGDGERGDGTTEAIVPVPSRVAAPHTEYDELSAWNVGCGIALSGATYCWGGNRDGELGTGSSSPETSSVPVPVDYP